MQQYIGFNLNQGEYTIPILKVREIVNMPEITRMPQSPSYVAGVTNLRGSIVPIVNIKKLVELGGEEGTGEKVIVVSSGRMTFGILVDGITGVINIDEASIEPADKFLPHHVDQIEGIAKFEDRLLVLLNPKKLIPCEDMGQFEDIVLDVKDVDSDGTVEVVRKVQTMAGEINIKELHNAKEFFDKKGLSPQDPRHLFIDDIIRFMEAVSEGDYEKADMAVQEIMKKGQSDLFNEVGKVTRKLHDSLKHFKAALDPRIKDIASVEMPNAVDKLQFVIDKTEEAAHKTMAIVEKYIIGMDDLAAHIRTLKGPDEAVGYLKGFKNGLEDDLTELLTTQSFQDITGQTIKKVITLVSDVEAELVRMIAAFGLKMESGTRTADTPDEKVSQSDVDDLLKDLGF